MNTLLYDLKYEIRRLMVAGVELAKGDARLSNLLPQLQKAGETAPVMKKLSELVALAIAVDNKARAVSIFDLAVLLNAVLYTQAKNGKAGDIHELPAGEEFKTSDISYRDASALMTALTTKGSGRYEIICDAIKSGLIYDMRFMPMAAGALGDTYAEIPPMIAEILPKYGKAVVKYILPDLDIAKATESNINRINVLAQVWKGEEGKDFFLDIYNNGSSKLKPAAIAAMSQFPEFESICLDAIKARASDVRVSGYMFFAAKMDDPEAAKIITDGFESDKYADVASAIARTENSKGMELIFDSIMKSVKAKNIDAKCSLLIGKLYNRKDERVYEVLKNVLACTFENYAETADSGKLSIGAIQSVVWNLIRTGGAKATEDFAGMMPIMVKSTALKNNPRLMHIILRNAYLDLPTGKFYELYHPVYGEKFSNTSVGAVLREVFLSIMKSSDESRNGFALDLDERWFDTFKDSPHLRAAMAKPGIKRIDEYLENMLSLKFKMLGAFEGFYWYYVGKTQSGAKDFLPKMFDKIEQNFLDEDFMASLLEHDMRRLVYTVVDNYYTQEEWMKSLVDLDPARFLKIFEAMLAKGKWGKQNTEYLEKIIDALKESVAASEASHRAR
jgi:hypothetical protein